MAAAGLSRKKGTTRRSWRFRRCPACYAVRPASEFKVTEFGPPWNPDGRMMRRCADCGHEDLTRCFVVVRERHAAGYGEGRHG